ncbi:Uma2 family endonuclease [Meiothermus sp.]|uniref:Uma2 family endonuclease n=1 Tax=Meiothermus sp. TaxID=1955249 RepID=UPI00307DB75E
MIKPGAQLMSIEEYFRTEPGREVRHEYVHGHIYAMAGGSSTHNRICANVVHLLVGLNLAHNKCRVYPSDMKLRIRDEKVYYPDAMVVCQGQLPNEFYETEPCLLVEVLSPSTKDIDQREKADVYRSLPSLQTYLIVDSVSRSVRRYWREGEEWRVMDYVQDGVIPLPCLQGEVSLEQIYRGIL